MADWNWISTIFIASFHATQRENIETVDRSRMVLVCTASVSGPIRLIVYRPDTQEACLDLKHVHEGQDVEFYTKKGVKLGIAKSFVGDVYLWAKDT